MLAALALLAAFSQAPQPITVDGMLCHPRNLMIKYQNEKALQRLESRTKVLRVMPEIAVAVVESEPGTLNATRKRLKALPGILRADLDRAAMPAYDPNDPLWPDQWDMRAIRADLAWDIQRGSQRVTV